ncbi:MAG: hypothetical protein Q9190_000494 [Brigantiaea leucoxantha]
MKILEDPLEQPILYQLKIVSSLFSMDIPAACPKSPLSPRDVNGSRPATVERKASHKLQNPPLFSIHQDSENNLTGQTAGLRKASSRTDIKLSPSKHKSLNKSRTPQKAQTGQEQPVEMTEEALREVEGAEKLVETMNGGDSVLDLYANDDASSISGTNAGYPGMDDTCFSTFSAVPNADMTLFAQIGQSPAKNSSPAKRSREAQYSEAHTPRLAGRSNPGINGRTTPATSRHHTFDECSSSPTPRRLNSSREGETTDLILDFTEQFSAFSQTSQISPSPHRPLPRTSNTQPDLSGFMANRRSPTKTHHATPSKFRSLLDFDLPPAPTPRSIPTITARELESLKSTFLSQISSLRATVSGKEAEVHHLKTAVEDAERRVGEALESVREERGAKESLQAEKNDWQNRDKEMASVLRSVKEEIIHEQHEHERLSQRFETSEKQREEAEAKLVKAESKIAGLQSAAAAASSAPPSVNGATSDGTSTSGGVADPARGQHVEAAVEKVARELHALYRSKHENKVAALKKSYEARWEKKIKDLESRISTLSTENEELRAGRDATMSTVLPPLPNKIEHEGQLEKENEDSVRYRREETEAREQEKARLDQLEREMQTAKEENESLKIQLGNERREMAELVRATEEMMQLSLVSNGSGDSTVLDPQRPSGLENLKGSFSKASSAAVVSGLKQPNVGIGLGESRIGRMGRTGSGSATVVVPGIGRSGIMGNIERMGRGRGRVGGD